MKKTLMTTLATLAVSFGLASTGSAVTIIGSGQEIHLPGYSRGTDTAEFTFIVTEAPRAFLSALCYTTGRTGTSMLADTNFANFQTFCLERSTATGAGVFALNTNAVNGGPGAGPDGDPLSVGSSWLYSRFARGILSDYNYTPGGGINVPGTRNDDARLLQNAIWALENELAAPAAGTNKFYDAVIAKFGAGAAADAAEGQNGVYVLNIWGFDDAGNPTIDRQDFMVHLCVPEGGSTLIVLGLSLCGLSLFRSRLQKKTIA